jgi:hydrogenase nickel incorporation protein HypA/HybF
MHELSLCRSIFAIADRARAGRPVEAIHLQVGALRQVVPETLAYCWRLMSEDTALHGSVLEIEVVDVELRCAACGCTTSPADRVRLVCAGCGSVDVAVARGEELLVASMDLRGRQDG